MRETKASMRSAKSLLFSFFISVFFLLSTAFPLPSFAQSSLPQSQLAPDVPETQHTIIHTLTNDVLSSLTCMVIGFDPNTPTNQCLIYDKRTDSYTYAPESNMGLAGTLLSSLPLMFDMPVHTVDYTRYVASNFGITTQSYAAAGSTGTGSQQLAPLLPFWIAMRNLVYLLYVIVFIVVGAGIMLRLKMDPRTVMTIQNQIPRIIISILLVTFSYAISGIMIDTMYVSIYTVYSLANRIDIYPKDNDNTRKTIQITQDDIFGQNPMDFVNNMFSIIGISYSTGWEGSRTLGNLILPREWGIDAGGDSTPLLGGLKAIAGFAVGGIFNIFKVLVAGLAELLGIIILPLIIGIAILVSLFKLWFTLIKSYIIIIINIILAPFWIFLGVFPGSKVNFESWFRQLAAYLLVFPATILLFIFAKLISVSFAQHTGSVYFAPPLIGSFGGIEAMSNIVAFGVILIGPILLDQLIIVLKAPTAGAISKAVQGGFMEGSNRTRKYVVSPANKLVGGALFGDRKNIHSDTLFHKAADPAKGQVEGRLGARLRNFDRTVLRPWTGITTTLTPAGEQIDTSGYRPVRGWVREQLLRRAKSTGGS